MTSLNGPTVGLPRVDPVTHPTGTERPTSPPLLDEESRDWLRTPRGDGLRRDEAVARLHALLLRAARFEVARRRPTLPHLRGNELDAIATEAADDALMSVWRTSTTSAAPAASRRGGTNSRSSRRP